MATADSTPPRVTFKAHPDNPAVMVGDDGTVLAFDGEAWHRAMVNTETGGYLRAAVRTTGSFGVAVHRLVLETFVGPRPPGMMCCHAPDTNPANNRLENLRWGTAQDNADDSRRYGYRRHTPQSGPCSEPAVRTARSPWRRVGKRELAEIRSAHVAGILTEKIADAHDLPVARVQQIIGFKLP